MPEGSLASADAPLGIGAIESALAHTHNRTLWFPAGSWEMRNGGTSVDVGATPDHTTVISLSATLDQEVLWTFLVPEDWGSRPLSATIFWAPGGTSALDCRWQIHAAEVAAGDQLNEASTTTTVIAAAPGVTAQLVQTEVADFLTPTAAGSLIRIHCMRTGSHASDTFANAASLIGVSVSYGTKS
jgi:hypothetical protein